MQWKLFHCIFHKKQGLSEPFLINYVLLCEESFKEIISKQPIIGENKIIGKHIKTEKQMKKKLIDTLKEAFERLNLRGEISLQPVPVRVSNRFGRNF